VDDDEQIQTKPNEQKYSTFDTEKLTRGYKLGIELEEEITRWAQEKKMLENNRRFEKFSALFCTLN